MQTRSITRKLANALATNSHVSDDCSAKSAPRHRSKTANSDKKSKSKNKLKSTVATDKMDVDVKKRKAQRLMTEEGSSVQNEKEVAEETSSVCSGKSRETKKKGSEPLPRSKRGMPTKRVKEEETEEVEKVKRVKKEKKIKEEEEEERTVKVEVPGKGEAVAESRPPTDKVKVEGGGGAVAEKSVTQGAPGEFPAVKSEQKIGIIKKEIESQMHLLDVKEDIKTEGQSSETEQLRESGKSETKMVVCKEERDGKEEERCPTQETQNKDPKPQTEGESVNGSEVGKEEAATTSVPKESHAAKPEETVPHGSDVRIKKLPEDFLNSVREKRLVIGGDRPEKKKKDKKKRTEESCKGKICGDNSYIPLNSSGATKFFVADMKALKKSGINHPAVDVKRDLLYGPRIRRVPYSKVLAYNTKNECRNMRY